MSSIQGKKPRNIKIENISSVFSLLRRNNNLSIPTISKEIGLSITSITKIVNRLCNDGFILNTGKGDSSLGGGKKPELYSINKDYKYAMVLIADNYLLVCCIFDIIGNLIFSYEENIIPSKYNEYVSSCAKLIEKTVANSNVSLEKLIGCCITCPGIIDAKNGSITLQVWKPDWDGELQFCKDLKCKLPFDLKLIIENNTRTASYIDYIDLYKDIPGSFVYISSWTSDQRSAGTGGAIINDMHMRRGINGCAGEFGHICVDYEDENLCVCGRKGCFQTMISGSMLLNYAKKQKDKYPDSMLWEFDLNAGNCLQYFFKASNCNDKLGMAVVDHAALYYARLIETIILTIDPSVIVIGGEFSLAGGFFQKTLQAKLNASGMFEHLKNLRIQYSNYTSDYMLNNAKSAALYFFDTYFNDSNHYE